MRCIITEITPTTARAVDDDGAEFFVQLAQTPFASLLQTARTGDTIEVIGGHEHRGILTPTLVILQPDLLIDVTTLCDCMKPYGFHALNSLLNRYESRETTWQIQLGNMANEFFDVCVNEPSPTFQSAVARSFHASPLTYCAIDGIDAGFFHDAGKQWNNIFHTVREVLPQIGIAPSGIILEPQFISPELGLQGRLDALCPDAIIELKSGKADEFHGRKPKEEHKLQMILYNEILSHIHKDKKRPRNLLFYSRYPQLQSVSHTPFQFQTAIAVRNDMIALDRDTREGRLPEILDKLTEADFNKNNEDGKLYSNYLRPVIIRFLERMQGLQPLERAYFHAFTRFIAREQHACKENFATLWRTPLADQVAEGQAVTGLTLHTITDMDGSVICLRAETSRVSNLNEVNFRRGDSVLLFEEGLHGQVFRCQIVGLTQHSLHLALAHKQRCEDVFHTDGTYAIVPAYTEATFTQAYRGLTDLVTASPERRALLLGTRKPSKGDYFLLVGPPGTGKTNVHLRDMVRKRLDSGQTLLLLAYTNQAVDEICGVLEDECPGIYARIGNENSCAPPYRPRMIQNVTREATNRKQTLTAIAPLRVICGTIAAITSHDEIFKLKHFDTTIVDEASQVLEPQILPILCRVGYFVLIGDQKQLPAVVTQNTTQCEITDPLLREIGLTNCANSYFERMYAIQERWGTTELTTATLRRQGRMHQELMQFVNKHFYGDILDIVPLPHQTATLFYDEARLQFIDVDCHTPCRNCKTNHAEAETVAEIVAHIQHTYAEHGLKLNPAKTIGVIVPFRAQITAIRNAITDPHLAEQITIDTVERYQGSQRDIIIFNTVVTNPEQIDLISSPVIMPDGTEIDRKLNVALTRARECFILVGNRHALMRSTLYAALIEHLEHSEP